METCINMTLAFNKTIIDVGCTSPSLISVGLKNSWVSRCSFSHILALKAQLHDKCNPPPLSPPWVNKNCWVN